MKTCELFRDHTVLSFEIFPPKPTSPEDTIYRTLDGLRDLHPDFISVTFGAGGGANNQKSLEIASAVKHQYGIESVAHLPGINLTRSEVLTMLEQASKTFWHCGGMCCRIPSPGVNSAMRTS